MEIDLFGETTVRIDGRTLRVRDFGGGKPRQILEILAVHAPAAVSKERMAELLWQGRPPTSYVATLEAYVSVLRGALCPHGRPRTSVVATVPGGYALDTARVAVDLAEFTRASRAALTARGPAAIALAEEAFALSQLPLLASAEFAEWAQAERGAAQRLAVEVACAGAAQALASGQPTRAERLARRATELDGLAEEAWRLRLRALATDSRRGEALRAYEELRRLLDDELGVPPAPATRELHREILLADDDPDDDPDRTSARSPRAPVLELVPAAASGPGDLDVLARVVAETVLRAGAGAEWSRRLSVGDLAADLADSLRPLADRLLPVAS